MNTSYKILFEVGMLHHYLLNLGDQNYEGMSESEKAGRLANYRIDDLFEIVPTDYTRHRASGARLLFKNTSNGFIVGTVTDPADNNKPFMDFTGREKFSFNIFYKDPGFLNFSALPINDNQNKIYHFNNLNKSAFQFPNLAGLPTEFDAALASTLDGDGDPNTFAYLPGDLVIDDQSDPTTLFEAIRSTNELTTITTDWRADSPAAVYDGATNYSEGDTVLFTTAGKDALYKALEDVSGVDPTDPRWEKISDLPLYYANRADRIPLYGPLLDYEFTAPDQNFTFDILDPFDNVVKSFTATSTVDNLDYQLDMRTMRTGKFSLRVTDNAGPSIVEEYSFYLLREPAGKSLFGVIDIYSGDDLGDYSLVDSNNEFQSPEFLLRFKNRSTVWRYIDSKNKTVVHESDFNPLTYSGIVSVPFDGNDLPNPGIQVIKPEATQYYSDIYL